MSGRAGQYEQTACRFGLVVLLGDATRVGTICGVLLIARQVSVLIRIGDAANR